MKKAFTLIELLVVIAIIGGLAALFLPNFMAARERARDSQRKADIKSIQKALEMYKTDQLDTSYPATGTLPAAGAQFVNGTTVYMSKFPAPPNNASDADGITTYTYSRQSIRAYTLCACLENKADSEGKDCPLGLCSCGTGYKCYYVNQP